MALSSNVGTWPESFFKAELNQNDMRILGDGISEMEKKIQTWKASSGINQETGTQQFSTPSFLSCGKGEYHHGSAYV